MNIVPMSVELRDFMGDDISVVDAARVSFNKESKWHMKPAYVGQGGSFVLGESDAKLIRYLAKHNHWSPFSHVFLSFRIKVPMFVAMQLDKHTVGLTTNSVSRRYVSSEPEFFFPKTWRKAAENVKQGSSEEEIDGFTAYFPKDSVLKALSTYNSMLFDGVCPEMARMVLPMNTMRESIWSGSLAAFARVYKLRSDPHSQKEIQDFAAMFAKQIPQQMEHSWKALNEV